MSKVAFVFPGQGSQYVGMGKDIFEQDNLVQELYYQAQEVLGYDLSEICFYGPENRLLLTEITQPAVLITSLAVLKLLSRKGIEPNSVAGHSLGEYSALAAAGSVEFQDAVSLVARRGRWMTEAVEPGRGAMAAVLGLSAERVEELCAAASGTVQIANYNCPGQYVISGDNETVEAAAAAAKDSGAKKVVFLKVSGPFHSSLMAPVGFKLRDALDKVRFQAPKCRFYANVTGEYIDSSEQIKELLVQQVQRPVRWEQTVKNMIADGVDTFIEVGPGKVLSGLIRKISRDVRVANVEDWKSLQALGEKF